jgi:hypothetical protein
MMIPNNPESGRGRRWTALALTVATAVLMAGCGDRNYPALGTLYPVKGRVLLPEGKPLPAVKVIFSGPMTNSAITESDGTFAFKGDRSGLAAGDYKIRLEITESKGTLKHQVLVFPSHYSDEDSSGLTASVKPDGPNDFEFQLTKGDAAAQGSPKSGRGPSKGGG